MAERPALLRLLQGIFLYELTTMLYNKQRRFVMQKRIIIWILALGLLTTMAVSARGQQWAIKGDRVVSCSCNSACPCMFGSSPTLGHCDGVELVEIKEGHYGNVRLDGISVVITLRLREWVKYYVNENATDEQVKVVGSLVAALMPGFAKMKVLSTEKAPISIERTETKVKFSVPSSAVEIEMMKGRDGKPIKIQNLPASFYIDYTQYKSITIGHHSKDKEFSYSGTHGATSKIEAMGEK